ncbi:nucleotide pyrophosphohydrolase [bacterium BRH_c32]|nr:MAG: nucleotide pyrophosphohydrolase [bacterium BRH_c32]
MNDFNLIIEKLLQFRDERDWEQFHNAKDLAIALNIEAGELLENFLWKSPEEVNVDKIKEELADVFTYAFYLAEKFNLDITEIVLEKIERNSAKYTIEKSKGNAKKYTEL